MATKLTLETADSVILAKICQYLSPMEILHLSEVCRSLNRVIRCSRTVRTAHGRPLIINCSSLCIHIIVQDYSFYLADNETSLRMLKGKPFLERTKSVNVAENTAQNNNSANLKFKVIYDPKYVLRAIGLINKIANSKYVQFLEVDVSRTPFFNATKINAYVESEIPNLGGMLHEMRRSLAMPLRKSPSHQAHKILKCHFRVIHHKVAKALNLAVSPELEDFLKQNEPTSYCAPDHLLRYLDNENINKFRRLEQFASFPEMLFEALTTRTTFPFALTA